MEPYRNDLAYIHDAGFGQIARAAAPVLLDALRRQGTVRGLVVDLGCGSGILARDVVDAGYEVLGIDISQAMIALARGGCRAGVSALRLSCRRSCLRVWPSRRSENA